MLIGLLGDTHGDQAWIRLAADRFADLGITTVIQVGDLGISAEPTSTDKWNDANEHLCRTGITMLVAPGNHEDYDLINTLTPDAGGWLPFRSHILLAPRGHRIELVGRTFVFLGGAGSVDRTAREVYRENTGVRTRWTQEAISADDVSAAAAGSHADVMITHESPFPVAQVELGFRGGDFEPADVAYARGVRMRLTEAVAAVQPELLVHGHHHRAIDDQWVHPDTGHVTRVRGLSLEFDENSLGVLDLGERLRWSPLPHRGGGAGSAG